MPYIVSCGVNRYLGTDNANRLAVVRSLGSALRFNTPAEGYRFIAKKANKNLKSRQWFSVQVDFYTEQIFPCMAEEGEDTMDVAEDTLQEDAKNTVALVTQENAELAPEYVRELLNSDFDVQAVVNALNVIRDEFSKLDNVHERLNRALSLYDRAISDIIHAIEGSEEESNRNALIDDVIRIKQLRKLRKCRRIIKTQLLLYNELLPVVSSTMRKGILQENLLRYASSTQKIYNTRIINYGVLMNADSYIPRNVISEMICDCMSKE